MATRRAAGDDVGPDAAAIAGLLADADRRRVLSAVELGAPTLDAVAESTGLDVAHAGKALTVAHAGKALTKLVAGGLLRTDGKTYEVDAVAISRAARAALARPPSDEHSGEPPARRKVLDVFVRNGRIESMPTAPSKRRIVFDWLAGRFEIGHRYTEAEVNALLEGHAEDHVSLRRALVDQGFLDRGGGEYWRSGGTVEVGDS
jgi:hypothetical protein